MPRFTILLAAFLIAGSAVSAAAQSGGMGPDLVLEGEVRVSRRAPDGRSLELYRVVPGELCLVLVDQVEEALEHIAKKTGSA